MQLKNKDVKKALFAASCSLLSNSSNATEYEFDNAIMYYAESDRVTAIEGLFQALATFDDESQFLGKIVYDSLTGASASGAVPQQGAQTFTTPSGNSQYDINGSTVPLDDTFLDTRIQLTAQWSQALGEDYTISGGLNFSEEHDYESHSVNAVIGRYFNLKNTTASVGISYAIDNIEPVGSRPIGLAAMVVDTGQFATRDDFWDAFYATRESSGYDDDHKETADLIFGLTQVINRRWITQFNLSFSEVDGYQTDPYKIISLIDATGTALSYHYEKRPRTRSKYALFAQSKYHSDDGIVDFSYRFADDDWGITSHTLESRYRFFFSGGDYIESHFRIYQQSAADFYAVYLLDGQALPEYASADYRVGKLDTFTIGLKYGMKMQGGDEYGVRLEFYHQAPRDVGAAKLGQLANLDLYPTLDAIIFQIDYKF